MRLGVWVIAIVCCLGNLARAQAPASLAGADPQTTRVLLITVGPGPAIEERFGHNALWFSDDATGLDAIYNWGVYDFEDFGFILRFIRGDMRYQMVGWADVSETFLDSYAAQGRRVEIARLALTPEQRERLIDFVRRQDNDATRFYRYDYYADNCSTRVRDAIDFALEGRLKSAAEMVQTHTTYHSHTRRAMAGAWVMYGLMDLANGPLGDRELSAWDEMFLPTRLATSLATISPTGDTQPLIRRSVIDSAGTLVERQEPPRDTPAWLIGGGGIGAALLLLARAAPRSRRLRLTLRTLLTLIGIACVAGTLISLNFWLFTLHWAAYRDLNLLAVAPLSSLAVLGWRATPRTLVRVAAIVLFCITAAFTLNVTLRLHQDNTRHLAAFAIATMLFAIGVRMWIRKTSPERSPVMYP